MRLFFDTVNDGGDHMADEENVKVMKPDYSLVLDNLRKALYTRTDNPYTGDGSIYYFDESKLTGDYKTEFFQKREMGADAFNPFIAQQKIMIAYRTDSGNSDSSIQINQLLFWTVHLAGWKRLKASPADEQIYRLFTDSKGATKKYRSEFKKDLEITKFLLNGDGSVILAPAGPCIPGTGQSELPVSEYIVECNYLIVKNYTGGRKALLRKVIGDFAQNIHDAERSRNDDGKYSMLPDNETEVKELCSCLNRMMLAYDQLPEYEIDKKDWLLGRSLAWLVIVAMLRNCLSMDLINSSLVPFLPPADGNLLPVPRLHIQDDEDFLIENFHPNEDTVYGRASQVQRISEFFGEQETGVGKSRIVYIQGIGGIGKSTLAKAFTEQFREKYNTVIEVSASGAKEAVMLMSASVPETIQYPVRLQRIRAYCIKKKMLLIVHDYNQPEDETYGDWGKLGCDIILTGWFDRGTMGLRTLRLTTNDGSDQDALSTAVEIFRSNYLKNAEMADDNELKAELEQVLDEQENSVQELCAIAGCHPLTIKVMAMQASCTPGLEERPDDLVSKYHKQKMEHAEARKFGLIRDGAAQHFGDALTHLEDVFAAAVRSGTFSKEEFSCLRCMTLVPYAWGISAGRFGEWAGENPEWLSLLTKKGWLEYDRRGVDVLSDDKAKGIYRMPMAIADVLCRLDETVPNMEDCLQYIKTLSEISISKEKVYLRREAYVSSAETAVLHLKEEESEEYASLLSQCAFILHHAGTKKYMRYYKRKIQIKALEIRCRVLGEDHPDTASSYSNVGMGYWNLAGERKKGLKYQEKALEIRRRVLGENHPDTASSYNNVGICYWNLGKHEIGLEYQEKALEIRLHRLGGDHPDTAQSYNNVGVSYAELGELQKGLEYQEKALEIRRRVLGEDHPSTAQSYNNVGICYAECGEQQKALEYQKKALEIRHRVLGEDHQDTAASYNKVGIRYLELKEDQKGLEYQEKALGIIHRVLGKDYLDIASSFKNIGYSNWNNGERQKGLKYT